MNLNCLRENTLLGIGHPILDIRSNVDDEFLKKYNLKKNSTITASKEHYAVFKDVTDNYNPLYLAGGCIHNALCVIQWIIEKPKVTTFVGCIGDDEYANLLEEEVTKAGIDARFERLFSKTTSSCAVLITDTARTLVTRIGDSNFFSEGHVKKMWPIVETAEYFYIMGFLIPLNFDLILQVAVHSYEKGKALIMNLSAEYICRSYSNEFLEVFPYIDVIFGNEAEALALGAACNMQSNDLRYLCLQIANLPKKNKTKERICVITRSRKPVICSSGRTVKEYPVITVRKEKIVDTNGAGDAFVGGFLSQFISEKSIDECVNCAIWAASESLHNLGCCFQNKSTYKVG